MVNTLRTIATVLVQLSGAVFALVGLGGFLMGTVLPYRFPHSRLYMFLQFLVSILIVFIGIAAVLRIRPAVLAVATCFLAVFLEEAYGMSHGFYLPNPPHYSRVTIALQVLLGLIPFILATLAWPRLRSMQRAPSNQSLQPTAGRRDV
jgi:hypothetical protein